MAQQRSTRQYVSIGIRVACIVLLFVVAVRDYGRGGMNALTEDLLYWIVIGALGFSQTLGRKLAAENMKKAGLQPDRDEAQPACKAIDNRSMEI